MLSRSALSIARRAAARSMSSEAASGSSVKLNFSLPHETIYNGTSVHSVIIPGSAGEYGVTANHVPYVAQLKPGVLQILHEENSNEPEKYFVAGGYALTHADSSTVRRNSTSVSRRSLLWF
jgi:F-type H+-transporting ATPase subunit delta